MAGLMRFIVFTLVMGLALAPTAAAADPIITPLIVGGLGSVGITVSASVGQFIGGLLLTGALAVASYLMRPDVPKPDDGTFSKKQSTPVREYAMGRCRKSGPWLFGESSTGGVAAVIYAIQDGRTDAIENIVLNNDVATLDGDDKVIPVDSIRYVDTTVLTRLGQNTQTAYDLVKEYFPEVYDDDHRCDGITTVMVSASSPGAKYFQRSFPSGWPEVSVIGRFGRFWDPRDPDQTPGARSTWKWSQNPIVLLLHYLCHHPHGFRRRWQDAYEPNAAMWIEAMDVCDERVPLSTGGTIERYSCGGYWEATTERKAVIAEILKSCDGWLTEAGDGSWCVFAGKYYPPAEDAFELNADNILALSPQRGVPQEDRAKAVVVTFTSPDHVYAEIEPDAWGEDDLQAEGIPVERVAYPVPWVHHFTQARRLAKREDARLKAEVRGVVTANLSAIALLRERYVKLNWPLFSSTTDIVIEVRKVTIELQSASVVVEFIKANPDIDDWDPETEEGMRPPVPAPPNVAVNPTPPMPTLVRIGRKIQLSVPTVEEFPTLTLEAEYRRGSDPWEKMFVPKEDELIARTDVLDDGTYEFRAYYVLGGYPGFVSPSAFYAFSVDEIAPPAVRSAEWNVAGGVVTIIAQAGKTPDNTSRLRLYRYQGSWNVGTATLVDRVRADPLDWREFTDEPASGDWRYRVVAENGSVVLATDTLPVIEVTVP